MLGVMQNHQLLEWYLEAGVDEAIADTPTNYFALTQSRKVAAPAVEAAPESPVAMAAPKPSPSPLHHTPSAAMAMARELADKATTLAELETAVRGFDGCAIKKTASKTVFSDGNPAGRVMIIGEAPGAQEDIQGIPFCGPSGQLLDRMLASIGLNREVVFISNTVFWRPPGNRQPSTEETQTCLPFVEKMIALVNPALLVLSGGTSTTTLLKKDSSISRLRGKVYDYSTPYLDAPVATMVTFHPSYLLRTPSQKRLAWHDMLMIKEQLKQRGISA